MPKMHVEREDIGSVDIPFPGCLSYTPKQPKCLRKRGSKAVTSCVGLRKSTEKIGRAHV